MKVFDVGYQIHPMIDEPYSGLAKDELEWGSMYLSIYWIAISHHMTNDMVADIHYWHTFNFSQ